MDNNRVYNGDTFALKWWLFDRIDIKYIKIMSAKVVENYSLLEVIGSGQYGKVYKAVNIKNNSLVAVKVVKIEKFKEVPKLEEFTMNEI